MDVWLYLKNGGRLIVRDVVTLTEGLTELEAGRGNTFRVPENSFRILLSDIESYTFGCMVENPDYDPESIRHSTYFSPGQEPDWFFPTKLSGVNVQEIIVEGEKK